MTRELENAGWPQSNMPGLSPGQGGFPPVGVYGIKPLPVAEKKKKNEE